jgi:hypothetical protein
MSFARLDTTQTPPAQGEVRTFAANVACARQAVGRPQPSAQFRGSVAWDRSGLLARAISAKIDKSVFRLPRVAARPPVSPGMLAPGLAGSWTRTAKPPPFRELRLISPPCSRYAQ